MKLVIVESPTKCQTIERYLGKDYKVVASKGHIRDLATSGKGGLGVDIDNGFVPTYVISKDKLHIVHDLQADAGKAEEVILATDPDREGEAIAWHLAKVLGLPVKSTKRLEFHEITRDSISAAMLAPRTIDLNLVASQETRRILDRIIGFRLSTLIYKKIHSRSAGRVQSATLKLIHDHEEEIENFKPEEFWNINTTVNIAGRDFNPSFSGVDGKAVTLHNEGEAQDILDKIPENLQVISVSRSFRSKESKVPFTTSTMQQEAFSRLKFKTKKTQSLAQQLYEGINVAGEHVGLITYMRTDSTRLSQTFIERCTNYILETYGKDYLGHAKQFKEVGLMQDAHEAIRPTANHRTPDSVRQYLSNDQYLLYKLIYNRSLASLMKPKKEEVLSILLGANNLTFKVELTHTVFKGYEIVYEEKDDVKDYRGDFPVINEGVSVPVIAKDKEQKFTQAPAHYSEAKLVKIMEEVGIGRPSTYSSTIETLRQRKYVNDAAGILTITEQGKKTAHVLDKYFPDIVNVQYTAQMENKLDDVQDGSESRLKILSEFYYPFIKEIESANVKMYKDAAVETGEMCPECGSPLVYKEGKNGKFVGCSNFPKCKYVQKSPKKEPTYTGEKCPECGSPLVERETARGKKFIACSAFPKCRYIKKEDKPVVEKFKEEDFVKPCPRCGGHLVKKKGKFGTFLGCTNYPTCHYIEKLAKTKRK